MSALPERSPVADEAIHCTENLFAVRHRAHVAQNKDELLKFDGFTSGKALTNAIILNKYRRNLVTDLMAEINVELQ